MGPFHAVGFGCALSSTEVDAGFCMVFLLSSDLKWQRKGKERGQSSSPEHPPAALCLMQTCPVKWHLPLRCLRRCGLFGFLLLWLPDLSGNK